MELRHLRYFVAVAEELSFRRAADRLSMAQPPLSQQIRDLESELGAALFDRTNRRVRLTAAGRVFLQDAGRILAEADEATRRARRAARGELGQITIGYTSLINYPAFPEVLRLYHARYPDVEILSRDLVTIEQMQQLHASALDVSFATYASLAATAAEQATLVHERILREPLVALLPRQHPLAARSPLPLAALADQPWIWFARRYDPTTYDHMMRLFERAGFRPHIAQEVNQVPIFIGLVAAGMGVSLAPASIRRVAGDAVAAVALAEPAPSVEFDIVWRRDGASSLVGAFLAVVREVAGGALPVRDPLPLQPG